MLPKEDFAIQWLLGVTIWPSRKQLVYIDFTHPKVKTIFSADYDPEYDFNGRSDVFLQMQQFKVARDSLIVEMEAQPGMAWAKLVQIDGETLVHKDQDESEGIFVPTTDPWLNVIEKLNKEYPLIPHVRASRLSSTVRRMKAEKELGIPVNRRAGFVISAKTGNRANEMAEQEWEKFYGDLSNELKADYPETYDRLFSPNENDKGEKAT